MADQTTTAEEMARQAGLPDGKVFRRRLRINLAQWHKRGSWRVAVGSAKHAAMVRELKALLEERR
jgi:hypothetical protein